MKLVLVRHGQALDERQDPQRGLSEEGKSQALRTAEWVAGLGLEVGAVFSSPKARARQTAEIIAGTLGLEEEILEITEGLLPGAEPEVFEKQLQRLDRDTVAVGHLPNLPALVARLCVEPELASEPMPPAGAILLEREEEVVWHMRETFPPGT